MDRPTARARNCRPRIEGNGSHTGNAEWQPCRGARNATLTNERTHSVIDTAGAPPTSPPTVFVSYAHEDRAFVDKLAPHLRVLVRDGRISLWHDAEILPGDRWDDEIERHLRAAAIIVLIVSADFINSEYIWDKELALAIARAERGTARVIPVIVRPCLWEITTISSLEALPTDGRAVTMWANEDEAFTDVARGIARVAQTLDVPPRE